MEGSEGAIKGAIDEIYALSPVIGEVTLNVRGRPKAPELAPFPTFIDYKLACGLKACGINSLYRHQNKAIQEIWAGNDVIIATPTASGKSLIYNIPIINKWLKNGGNSRALYLFPLKALQQDQLRALERLISAIPSDNRPEIALLDGDTPQAERNRLKSHPPHILITNPDMLHYSILPYRNQWADFLRGLDFVVIDEVHTYRGIVGTNMAWVFRRLERICKNYSRDIQYILTSATIGNPMELGELLVMRSQMKVITKGGAGAGMRHFLFIRPYGSAISTCLKLMEILIRRDLRTIVYTQSRRLTELLGIWMAQSSGDLKRYVEIYRAGLLPEERRAVEKKMMKGELLGVISTSALELGIDIGGLDCSILMGFAGSIMASRQRWGRAGRRKRPSLHIFIAGDDALDNFILKNPRHLLRSPPEPAVLNPKNLIVLKKHLKCAAFEHEISSNEAIVTQMGISSVIKDMVKKGDLLEASDALTYFCPRGYPHRDVDLRGAGEKYKIIYKATMQYIGEIDEMMAFKECHPGAVYLHAGKRYFVKELDIAKKKVIVEDFYDNYFTRPVSSKETSIIEHIETKLAFDNIMVAFGRLMVKEEVTGFEKRQMSGQKLIGKETLDLPPIMFETEGLWFIIPSHIKKEVEKRNLHFMGGIHAIEHAMIGIMPLLVLTDRRDIGGISHVFHPQLNKSAIFIYDGIQGGAGFAFTSFKRFTQHLEKTFDVISQCSCDTGCPACVHSPKCGSGNRPIDKECALFILREIVKKKISVRSVRLRKKKGGKGNMHKDNKDNSVNFEGNADKNAGSEPPYKKAPDISGIKKRHYRLKELKGMIDNFDEVRYGVFDLETQCSAQDVGGWHKAHKMRMSCGVIYDSSKDDFFTYMEGDADGLIEHLLSLDFIVGFNIKGFDYKVLSAYTDMETLRSIITIDLLEEIKERLGYRLSLDHLASHTLGAKKAGNGLLAIKWWREKQLDKLISYCKEDVRITRDLFLYILKNDFLIFKNRNKGLVKVYFM